MRVKGQDMIDWYSSIDGDIYYVDDFPYEEDNCGALIHKDTKEPVNPTGTYELLGIIVLHNPNTNPPAGFTDDPAVSMRRFLKARATKTFVVGVPKDAVDAFLAYCKENGYKAR